MYSTQVEMAGWRDYKNKNKSKSSNWHKQEEALQLDDVSTFQRDVHLDCRDIKVKEIIRSKHNRMSSVFTLCMIFLPASLLSSWFSQGYQCSRHCLDTRHHSADNYTFQKHACAPVYTGHPEVLLLLQLKDNMNKYTHMFTYI